MKSKHYSLICSLFGLISLYAGFTTDPHPAHPSFLARIQAPGYSKTLRFNVYRFDITTADSGRTREVAVKAWRGQLLLTNFRFRTDGAVIGADVADLDSNGFPELYVYSTTDGSGSFGNVYGWQFLPERRAAINTTNWRPVTMGYMGHDTLWTDKTVLCRKFPVYQPGDENVSPSGGVQMIRYQLRPSGVSYVLAPAAEATADR